jgi:hypothetical protein
VFPENGKVWKTFPKFFPTFFKILKIEKFQLEIRDVRQGLVK